MAFTWEQVLKGKGTLQEFLTYHDERDDHIVRLMLKFFGKAGCHKDDLITVDHPPCKTREWDWKDYQFGPGWVLIVHNVEDPVFALYKDGKPKAAFYASYRGPYYQAGGYIVETDRCYAADNFTEGRPHGVWIELEEDEHTGASQICEEFLLPRWPGTGDYL